MFRIFFQNKQTFSIFVFWTLGAMKQDLMNVNVLQLHSFTFIAPPQSCDPFMQPIAFMHSASFSYHGGHAVNMCCPASCC